MSNGNRKLKKELEDEYYRYLISGELKKDGYLSDECGMFSELTDVMMELESKIYGISLTPEKSLRIAPFKKALKRANIILDSPLKKALDE